MKSLVQDRKFMWMYVCIYMHIYKHIYKYIYIYGYIVKLQSILKVLSNKFANLSRSKGRFNLNCQLLQTLWYIPH